MKVFLPSIPFDNEHSVHFIYLHSHNLYSLAPTNDSLSPCGTCRVNDLDALVITYQRSDLRACQQLAALQTHKGIVNHAEVDIVSPVFRVELLKHASVKCHWLKEQHAKI